MRICEVCGRAMTKGMTDDFGTFYAHEGKCFNKYMNRTYGKHRWMQLGANETDGFGGYYIYTADVVGGFAGTGIYYTEWEEEPKSKRNGMYNGNLI